MNIETKYLQGHHSFELALEIPGRGRIWRQVLLWKTLFSRANSAAPGTRKL